MRFLLSNSRIIKFLLIYIPIFVLITLFVIFIFGSQRATAPQKDTSYAAPAPVVPISLNSKIMFVGDIFWSRRMNTWSQASSLKEKYPFSGLSGFHKENYDAWIGNLECPVDLSVKPTQYEEEILLKFNCPSSYLVEFSKWFDVVSLANNHTDNQGSSGFKATQKELDKVGMQYFGHYDPASLKDVCETISIPVHIAYSDNSKGKEKLPIALCGYHGVFKIPPKESIAIMNEYAKYMPVIAYPHMGVEYQSSADALRKSVYRSMIDNGADAVLANHPHWVQNSESYKGKPIVYSMGNFIFDQQGSTELTRSAVITLSIALDEPFKENELENWIAIGKTCQIHGDDCIEQAKKQNLERLPLKLEFGMSASQNSNKITQPASDSTTQSVANRLQWNTTAKDLRPMGLPFEQ